MNMCKCVILLAFEKAIVFNRIAGNSVYSGQLLLPDDVKCMLCLICVWCLPCLLLLLSIIIVQNNSTQTGSMLRSNRWRHHVPAFALASLG